jgi:hypothetical protein
VDVEELEVEVVGLVESRRRGVRGLLRGVMRSQWGWIWRRWQGGSKNEEGWSV